MAYETNDLFAEHFSETAKAGPPRYLGKRFDAAGTFLPEPGNTVVSAVVSGSATETALVKVRNALMSLPYGDRFAWTPVSSYHMTVFQGTIEGRRKADYWPVGVSLDMPIEETTALFLERLEGFAPAEPFRMRIVEVTPLGLSLTGATAEDERRVRTLRDRLAGRFGYRHPDHDEYTFHVTLAYLKAWLPAEATAVYLPALRELTSFAAEVDVLELGPPALCAFDDMNAFRPLRMLG